MAGCRWDGSCREPTQCSGDEDDIRSRGAPNGDRTGLRVLRKPMDAAQASLCDSHPECTSIYRLSLDARYTTGPPNCNDIGFLPPHGRDQLECTQIAPDLFGDGREGRTSSRDLRDYTSFPFPEDVVKQNLEVPTALLDASECWDDRDCPYPLGYMTDIVLKGKSICLEVTGAEEKWIEIMAASRQGSNGGSYCVADWLDGGNEACTKEGDLYQCRESNNPTFGDALKLKFYAADNIDDARIEIYFRVTASKLAPGKTGVEGQEKDAEDWCQFRDSADYPASLLKPYPDGFDGLPVFKSRKSAAAGLGPLPVLVAAATAAWAAVGL